MTINTAAATEVLALSFSNHEELCSYARVSKNCKAAAYTPRLWNGLLKNVFLIDTPDRMGSREQFKRTYQNITLGHGHSTKTMKECSLRIQLDPRYRIDSIRPTPQSITLRFNEVEGNQICMIWDQSSCKQTFVEIGKYLLEPAKFPHLTFNVGGGGGGGGFVNWISPVNTRLPLYVHYSKQVHLTHNVVISHSACYGSKLYLVEELNIRLTYRVTILDFTARSDA